LGGNRDIRGKDSTDLHCGRFRVDVVASLMSSYSLCLLQEVRDGVVQLLGAIRILVIRRSAVHSIQHYTQHGRMKHR
jgi:hypothetical protein